MEPMDNPKDFPVEGDPDVCPKCDPKNALVAGVPSVQLSYLGEEPYLFPRKRKQANHNKLVTFTTDFKECRTPTVKSDLKASIFKPGYQRVWNPGPLPTSYSSAYPWSAPVPPSPHSHMCRDHSPTMWQRPISVFSPRGVSKSPENRDRVPQSAYVDPATDEWEYEKCKCHEPLQRDCQVQPEPIRLQSPPRYTKKFVSHHEKDRAIADEPLKSLPQQRFAYETDQRRQVDVTATDAPRSRTRVRKVSKSPNPQPHTGSTRRMTREDRPRHADLAVANRKRREAEAKVRKPYVSPVRNLHGRDLHNRKSLAQKGHYDTQYNQNYKDWVSFLRKKKVKDSVRYGSTSPYRNPSDPRFLQHHHTMDRPRNSQWKTQYTSSYEKPMERYYGSKRDVVSHYHRPPQSGESDKSTTYTADTDDPWYRQYVDTFDRAAMHRWKSERTNFDFYNPFDSKEHKAPRSAPYSRPQDDPSSESSTSDTEVQEPVFRRTRGRPATPASKRVEALDVEDIEEYSASSSDSAEVVERRPVRSIMKDRSPGRVRTQSPPPPPDRSQLHKNRERPTVKYSDDCSVIGSRPSRPEKERYDVDENCHVGQRQRTIEGKNREKVTEYDIIGTPSLYDTGTYIVRTRTKTDQLPPYRRRMPTPELIGCPRIRHHLDITTSNPNRMLQSASVDNAIASPHQNSEHKPHLRSTAPIYPTPSCSKIIDNLEEKLTREDTEIDPKEPQVIATSKSPYHQNCTSPPPKVGKKENKGKLHQRVADSSTRTDTDSLSCHTCSTPTRSKPRDNFAAAADGTTDRGRPKTAYLRSSPKRNVSRKKHEKKSMRLASVGRGTTKSSLWAPKTGNTALKPQQKRNIYTKAPAGQLYSKPLPQFAKSKKEQFSSPTVRSFKGSLSNPKGQTCCVAPQLKGKENDFKSRQPQKAVKMDVPVHSVYSKPSNKGFAQPCPGCSPEGQSSLSNCSVVSELLEKARNRRDQFWRTQPRSHHPQE